MDSKYTAGTKLEVEVTINRVKRTVVAELWISGWWYSEEVVALARCGRHNTGKKLHPVRIAFREEQDGTLTPLMHTTVLNRQGMIVAWNEERFQALLSQHNGSSAGDLIK
jgi:hypothetical protein